jgi:hypothetical protein
MYNIVGCAPNIPAVQPIHRMETIRAAGGIIAEGCGSRHGGGRWQDQAAVQKGAHRRRQQPLFEYSEFDMHVDAVQARNDCVARSVALHTSIDAEEEEEEEQALEEAQEAVDGEGLVMARSKARSACINKILKQDFCGSARIKILYLG